MGELFGHAAADDRRPADAASVVKIDSNVELERRCIVTEGCNRIACKQDPRMPPLCPPQTNRKGVLPLSATQLETRQSSFETAYLHQRIRYSRFIWVTFPWRIVGSRRRGESDGEKRYISRPSGVDPLRPLPFAFQAQRFDNMFFSEDFLMVKPGGYVVLPSSEYSILITLHRSP